MRSFVKVWFALSVTHFVIIFTISYIYFLNYGFKKNEFIKIIEYSLGIGVVKLGLPDSLLGWFINSVIYGLVGTIGAFLILNKRIDVK